MVFSECFLLGWGGGKTIFKRFLLKRLVWLTTSSCVVSIIISLDLYILLFRKSSLAAVFVLLFMIFFFCLHKSGVVCKVERLFPLVLDVQPPNIYLGACITPEDIQKAHTPPLKYNFIVRRRVFKSFSHWLIWRWNIFVV